MLEFGDEEMRAVEAVARSGKLFRYTKGGQCERFETRLARYLKARHVGLASSGSTALTAALGALGIGPGDEVIVPAHTYMATAIAVLAVGAIPVIVDVDQCATLDADALADAVGPRTRAVIPVHMWGTVCDMDAIMRVARRKKLFVVEDACQCVGGGYEGRKVGSIGHFGAFSFNYFKTITCGEGGAVVTSNEEWFKRARCMIDCCAYFWSGRQKDFLPFAAAGARASEFEGAMLNSQLDRLPGLLAKLRRIKKAMVRRTGRALYSPPSHSPNYECATGIFYQFADAERARQFSKAVGGTILIETGRHTYTEWDPVLNHQGAHHPAMNPFLMPQNKGCRMKYSKDMCPRSLDLLARTVQIRLSPHWNDDQVDELVWRILVAAGMSKHAHANITARERAL